MFRENIIDGPGSLGMQAYVLDMAVILSVAFILGYLLRLMLNSNHKDKIAQLETEIDILKVRIAENKQGTEDLALYASTVKKQKDELDKLNQKLSDCYSIKLKVENELVRVVSERKKELEVKPQLEVVSKQESSGTVMELVKEAQDLKRIEGIGPKIEQILNAGDIKTYSDLIKASVENVKAILFAAGPNYAVHDPSTWAEQAKLARDDKWSELKALQLDLKGGRRK